MTTKQKNTDSAYADWIQKEWIEQGGLIQPQIAAGILNVTIARIKQMRDEGKLNEYKDPNGKIMLSFSQVIEAKNNKLKDYKISYHLKIRNLQTEEVEISTQEFIVHRTKPPTKKAVIREVYEEFKVHENYLDTEIYNIEINQKIE